MADAFTFFTYGDVNGMYGMLNAVVMIMGSDSYAAMKHMMIGFGAIMMILYMAPGGVHAHRGWKWLVTVALISSLLFVPKADVVIEDATGQQTPAVVANVPYALAFIFGTKSSFGYELTKLAETGFQNIVSADPKAPNFGLPGELTYLQHGMLFGARAMNASRSATITDAMLRTDLTNYVKDCVIPSVNHLISMDDLMTTNDLWGLMANTNKALFAAYWNGTGYQYDSCPIVYSILDMKIAAATTDTLKRLARMMFPQAGDDAAAVAMLQPGLVAAYAKANIGAAAADANTIILQNTMINLMSDAASAGAIQMGDASSVLQAFAKQQASVQVNSSLIAEGEAVSSSLALLKNVLDIVLLAAFPVIAVLMIATEGEMLRSLGVKYILALLCMEVWPFFNAAISYIGNMYAEQHMAAAGMMPGSGTGAMALVNADAIYSGAISDLAVIGWAMRFIPVLAAGLFFGFDRAVNAMASVTGITGPAGSKAGEAAEGNAHGGQVSFDSYGLAMQKTDPNMVRMENVAGTSYFDARNPFSAESRRSEARLGSSPVKTSDVFQSTQRWSEVSREQESLARGHTDRASNALRANLSDAIAYAQSRGDRQSLDQLMQLGRKDDLAVTADQRDQLTERLAQELGISVTEDNRRQLSSSVGTILNATASTPGSSVLPVSVTASVQHQLTQSGSKTNAEQVKNALQRTSDEARLMSIGNQAAVMRSVLQQKAFNDGDQSGKDISTRVNADLGNVKDYTRSAELALRESREYSQAAESARSATSELGFDFVREYNAFAFHATGRDINSLSSTEHGALMKKFFMERTQLAHDDKGAFLAIKDFAGISEYLANGMKVTSSDQNKPTASDDPLKQDFDKSRHADLGKEAELGKGNASEASVRSTAMGNRLVPIKRSGGMDPAKPVSRPEDLTPTTPEDLGSTTEIRTKTGQQTQASRTANDEQSQRLDNLMESGLKSNATGPMDIHQIDKTHRPMPGTPKPIDPVDLIPKDQATTQPKDDPVNRIPK